VVAKTPAVLVRGPCEKPERVPRSISKEISRETELDGGRPVGGIDRSDEPLFAARRRRYAAGTACS
jgi:hypothetical protein